MECLESGVFRADIPCKFKVKPAAFQKLIDQVRSEGEALSVPLSTIPLSVPCSGNPPPPSLLLLLLVSSGAHVGLCFCASVPVLRWMRTWPTPSSTRAR